MDARGYFAAASGGRQCVGGRAASQCVRQCVSSRFFPDPLGIVTAEALPPSFMRGVAGRSEGRGESVRRCGGCRSSTVIASQCAHWRGDRRECLWCNPFSLSFGHAPDGADTSSDPPLAGHLLLKEKALGGVLGTASTVGAAIGRPLLQLCSDTERVRVVTNRTAPAYAIVGGPAALGSPYGRAGTA